MSFLTDYFVRYAKTTSPGRMVLHSLMLMMLSTWLGLVVLVSSNFQTVLNIYNASYRNSQVDVRQAMIMTDQINTIIKEQRILIDVDRLYVAKFHNGKVDLNGVHFLFFTRVSEAGGPGVSYEVNNAQNLPLSVFPGMITKLVQDKCYYIETVNSSVENHVFLEDMGVQSLLICPILNGSGKIIGLIGAEGVRAPINKLDRTRVQTALETLATVLGALLSVR